MIDLPWGEGVLHLPIPSGWRVLARHEPADLRADLDVATLCQRSLGQPLGAAPLRTRQLHGRRALVVVDDVSRPTPVAGFFAVVRDELLAAGVKPEDTEVLFALGVHRPMTEAEAQAKVGKANLAQHRWHNHDAADVSKLARLGSTSRGTPVVLNRLLIEFDLIVTLGALEPHVLLGVSGGAKMLLPGCAGLETIGCNHLQGVGAGRYNYVGVRPDDSPMRLDLEEAVGLMNKDVFCVNAMLNARGEVVRFFIGEPRQVVRAGGAFLEEHARARLTELADIVITNSRPFDADLRQGMKCVGNTLEAARPGGLILACLRCEFGRGDIVLPSWTLPHALLRTVVNVIPQSQILTALRLLRPGDPIEQRFLGHFSLQMARRNPIWLYSDRLEPGTGKRLGTVRQYEDVERMLADAIKKTGPRASVAVFPFGGATYVLPPAKHS